jgi:hypothetical protein
MLFYAQYVGRFPDEIQHISYIAYLEKTHTIIPDFKDMTTLEQKNSGNTSTELSNKNIASKYTFSDSLNYLGHPPLYYELMSLSRAVKVKDNNVTVNIFKLRCFTISLSAISMLLVLYIGYSRIGKNPLLHCVYVTIAVSVPMLAYDCAGVNNDTLALLGLSVYILGLLRFSEKKLNFFTYFIISLGVFISFMAKFTAGLVVFISLFLYVVLIIIKEKNAWFLISKKFFATLPMYLATGAYYLVVYLQTGSILPTYELIDPQGFYKSVFYVAIARRTHMNFIQYTVYFAKNFLMTWTGIASQVTLLKTSLHSIALLALLFLPIILVFQIRRAIRNSSYMLVLISVYLGLAISTIIQWLRAYNEYTDISGYLGGFQSRYYLCGISAIALAITFIIKDFIEKSSVTKNCINFKKLEVYFICLLFICLLFYEDFIYFLIHFKDYL